MAEPPAAPITIAAFSAADLSLPLGHALHLRGLLDALADRGHAITLVTPRPAGRPPPVRFVRIEIPALRWRVLTYWSFEILGGFSLLIHCMRRRPDCLFVRHDLYTSAAALVARLLQLPLAVQVNSSIPEELIVSGRRRAHRIVSACERITLREARRVVVLAASHGEDVARRTGIDRAKIDVVPIGCHLPATSDPVATRSAIGIAPASFVVGFAGNLSPVQGIETLIDACAQINVPERQLWIIGTGIEEARLRRLAAPQGACIRFFGGVSRERTEELMQACQVLVAPYRRPDYDRISGGGALSSKVLAYLAADRPVLISDIPSYSWIEEIGAGECYPADRPEALAHRLAAWAERWRDAGRPLSNWPHPSPGPGRRFVEKDRTWDHSAARLEAILLGMSTSGGRSPRSRVP